MKGAMYPGSCVSAEARAWPPSDCQGLPQAGWRKPMVWGAPWSGAGSFAQSPQSVPVASQQARTHNTRCPPCNSSGQRRERPPRLCSAATVHWPVAAGMSWESDASSCMPPTLEDPTAEPLSNQLEALRLKVSPAMKEEVSNVLEALAGEMPAARTCPRTNPRLPALVQAGKTRPQRGLENLARLLPLPDPADIISQRIYGIVSDGIDSEEEAKMWSCFAQVYQTEVRTDGAAWGHELGIARLICCLCTCRLKPTASEKASRRA